MIQCGEHTNFDRMGSFGLIQIRMNSTSKEPMNAISECFHRFLRSNMILARKGSWILISIIAKKGILNVDTKFVEDHETGFVTRSSIVLKVRNEYAPFCFFCFVFFTITTSLTCHISTEKFLGCLFGTKPYSPFILKI